MPPVDAQLTTAASRKPAGVIPSLDGIRAFAVMLVLLAHSGLQHIVPGGLGVTIFFVLSGYLITTLMCREHADTGTIGLRAFYLRRLLRLMPTLLIVITLASALSAVGLIAGGFTITGLLSVLFYLGNYFVITHHFIGIPAGLGVVWSLAVEEDYYLFYPPLALLLFHLKGRHITALLLASLCVLVLAWRIWLAEHGASADYLEMATDTRIDAILVGCVMALWCNPWLDPVLAEWPLRDTAITVGCIALLLFTLLYRNDTFRLTLRYTLQSVAIAPLIYMAVARSTQRPFRWLNIRPMKYLGVVSYSVYLSHQMFMYGIELNFPNLGWAATLAGTVILALTFSEVMRRWVDAPFVLLRRRLHHGRPKTSRHAESLQSKP